MVFETVFISDLNDCFTEFKRKALLNSAFAIQKGYTIEECRCICSSTWNSTDAIVQCRSFNYFADRRECVLNSADQSKRFTLVNMNEHVSYHEFVCHNLEGVARKYANYACSQITPTQKFPLSIDDDQCFEEVNGYVLNGLAGALEHDVTFDQCKCLCATSDISGKYNFPCKSVMYYPIENDCVLNAGNRLERPDLFRKDTTSYQIIYSGITCESINFF